MIENPALKFHCLMIRDANLPLPSETHQVHPRPGSRFLAVPRAMAEKGFRWLFLHPGHTPPERDARAAPVPWREYTPSEGSGVGRYKLLLNLLRRALADQELSTLPLEAGTATAAALPRFVKETAAAAPKPILNFAGGEMQGIDEAGNLIFSVT